MPPQDTLRLNGRIHFKGDLAPRREERSPVLHLYLSAPLSSEVHRMPMALDAEERWDARLDLKWDLKCAAPLPRDASLNVDMFVEDRNHQGQWCRIKAGSTTVLLSTLLRVNEGDDAGHGLAAGAGAHPDARGRGGWKFPLAMPTANYYTKGVVTLFLEGGGPEFTPPTPIKLKTAPLMIQSRSQDPQAFVPGEAALYDEMLRRVITDSERVWDRLEPSWELLRGFRAPLYQSRVGPLPGPCFAMFGQGPVHATERYMDNCLRIALERREMSMAEFLHASDGRAAVLMAETCAVYANYAPYAPDQVNRNHRQHTRDAAPHKPAGVTPIESFDVLRVRDAGDCEDSAREIALHLDELRRGHWQTPGVLRMQRLRHHYCCVMALAVVTSAALSGGNSTADITTLKKSQTGGHMYTMLWPVDWVLEELERSSPAAAAAAPQWMRDHRVRSRPLEVLILEGTGKLRPEPVDRPAGRAERVALEQGAPEGLFRKYRQTMTYANGRESAFYKACTTVFTGDLVDAERGGVAEIVITRQDGANYGARFQEICQRDPVVGLLAQPAFSPSDLRMLERMRLNEHPEPTQDLGAAPEGTPFGDGARVAHPDDARAPRHAGLDQCAAALEGRNRDDRLVALEMYARDEDLGDEHCAALATYLQTQPQVQGVEYRREPVTERLRGWAVRILVTPA